MIRPASSRGLLLLARFTLRQVAWTRRSLVAVVLLTVPSALAAVIRVQAPPGTIDQYLRAVLPNLLLFLSVLATLFITGSVVRDGIEDRTLPFLLTRPLGRARTVLGLYLGSLLFLVPLVVLAGLGGLAAGSIGLPAGGPGSPAGSSGSVRLALVLAGIPVLHGAIFTLLGLLTRHTTVFGMLLILVLDGGVASLAGRPRYASPISAFESLLLPEFQTRATLHVGGRVEELGYRLGSGEAAVLIVAETAVLLVLLAWRARRMDFQGVAPTGAD
jgi:ABC-type transport system involved in multi-copper enzyme maturation permease subunit